MARRCFPRAARRGSTLGSRRQELRFALQAGADLEMAAPGTGEVAWRTSSSSPVPGDSCPRAASCWLKVQAGPQRDETEKQLARRVLALVLRSPVRTLSCGRAEFERAARQPDGRPGLAAATRCFGSLVWGRAKRRPTEALLGANCRADLSRLDGEMVRADAPRSGPGGPLPGTLQPGGPLLVHKDLLLTRFRADAACPGKTVLPRVGPFQWRMADAQAALSFRSDDSCPTALRCNRDGDSSTWKHALLKRRDALGTLLLGTARS